MTIKDTKNIPPKMPGDALEETDAKTAIIRILYHVLRNRDLFVLVFSSVLSLLIFGPFEGTETLAFRATLFFAALLGAIFFLQPGSLFDEEKEIYDFVASLVDEMIRIVLVGCGSFLLTGLTAGFLTLPLSFWLFWLFSAVLTQGLFYYAFQKLRPVFYIHRVARDRVVIICAGEQGQKLAEKLTENCPDVRVSGYFDDRERRVEPQKLTAPFLGKIEDIIPYVQNNRVDNIIIALPGMAEERLKGIIKQLEALPTPIFICPGTSILNKPQRPLYAHGRPQMSQLTAHRVTGWQAALKRLEDIVVALVALTIFLPLFIVLPILIKLESPGPVFYHQDRYGFNNRLFRCLKFRSMRLEACESAKTKITLTERNDPRVTKIGNFIRKTSLDEIPQFINVLKGDMSIVGPRPHPPGVRAGERIYEDVIENFAQRYKVKPGITGWAQINGARGNTFTEEDLRKRFEYDMEYIQSWSLWKDIVIILRTFFLGFTGKNAF